MLFVFWFNAVCAGCLLLQVWSWRQSQAAVQMDHTGSLAVLGFYRSPEHINEFLCCPGVCFDYL